MENTGAAIPEDRKPLIYLAGMDEQSRKKAVELAAVLRANGINAEVDLMARSVKAQFKYADKIGAKFVAAIGETELESGEVSLKNMSNGESHAVKFSGLCSYLLKI